MLCQLAYTVYAYRPWKFVVPNNIESINARVGYAAEGILAQLNVIISFLSLWLTSFSPDRLLLL